MVDDGKQDSWRVGVYKLFQYAGGFELSVGAGLISVLFILAISLTESIGRNKSEP